MALISNPQILFLDEPTLGLDVLARRELWASIGALKGKVTIILTTHYLEEVEALSDRIGIMANGKLTAIGTVAELKKQTGTSKLEDALLSFQEGRMRINLFAKRNAKEILRDPINLFFGLGFPLILLVMLSVINSSIPAEANNTMFSIENLAPGLAMFGTAFMALFSGMLLSKDRASSFLMRLFASPMTSFDFIVGYTLPMIVMASAQA